MLGKRKGNRQVRLSTQHGSRLVRSYDATANSVLPEQRARGGFFSFIINEPGVIYELRDIDGVDILSATLNGFQPALGMEVFSPTGKPFGKIRTTTSVVINFIHGPGQINIPSDPFPIKIGFNFTDNLLVGQNWREEPGDDYTNLASYNDPHDLEGNDLSPNVINYTCNTSPGLHDSGLGVFGTEYFPYPVYDQGSVIPLNNTTSFYFQTIPPKASFAGKLRLAFLGPFDTYVTCTGRAWYYNSFFQEVELGTFDISQPGEITFDIDPDESFLASEFLLFIEADNVANNGLCLCGAVMEFADI